MISVQNVSIRHVRASDSAGLRLVVDRSVRSVDHVGVLANCLSAPIPYLCRMPEIEAIRRLIALYGQLLDSKRFDEWGELFEEDAVFRVWGQTYQGREAIVREIAGIQPEAPGKHVALQPVIDFDDADKTAINTTDNTTDDTRDKARAWTDFCALSSGEDGITIATIARYHDRLVRDSVTGRWRFSQRVIVMGGEDVPDDVEPSPAY